MDFNRQNTQSNPAFRQPAPSASQPDAPVATHGGKKRGRKLGLPKVNNWGLVLIAAILVAFGLLWYFKANSTDEISQVNKAEYQAVFLSNGQVYFGKLVKLNNDYAKITHIFYLQVKQTVQPKQNSDQDQNKNVSLQKLGNEIHGPEDAMMINRTQIVFWENLKPTGQVSQAIKRYYQNGGNTNTTSQTPASGGSNSTNSGSTGSPAPSSSNSSSSTSTTPPPASGTSTDKSSPTKP